MPVARLRERFLSMRFPVLRVRIPCFAVESLRLLPFCDFGACSMRSPGACVDFMRDGVM